MTLDTGDYLNILKDDIHSAVFATVDRDGHPAARVIDIMLADENTLYFITAKGKEFYRQLTERKYVAISGMTGGGGSLSKKAISIRGEVKELGAGLVDRVFEENPYMAEIYPDKESRMAITVFCVTRGRGEYFDLSVKPITRKGFLIGDWDKEEAGGYFITRQCRGCGNCLSKCPQTCIITAQVPFEIQKEHCIRCGNCLEVCPFGAVVRREEDGRTAGQAAEKMTGDVPPPGGGGGGGRTGDTRRRQTGTEEKKRE